MARKTNKPADEQQKPFDPWTATKEEADKAFKTLLSQRGLSGIDVSFARDMLDNPEIDILNRWRVAQKFLQLEHLAKTDHRNETENGSWGASLLIAIKEATHFRLLLPAWIEKELQRILLSVQQGRRNNYKTSGWNNPNALGWPYPNNKSNLTTRKRGKIATEICRIKHSDKYKEKVKGSGIEVFEKIVDILKSEGKVVKLSASSARDIWREYKKEFESLLEK